ncbi:exonuclease domain-containing protein [Plesiomonas shigelloides]|uniref:exonuclease domain-containing protein n=1 Tax=Plesiomonas shigelloides TaxID=703 RepID=UPI00224852A8|nr:exonuclease domain-containing protein [Plesiomonas shigelloides]MCX2497414.1 exonuclease domain-containing protein [Plesiomonas shigelloides]
MSIFSALRYFRRDPLSRLALRREHFLTLQAVQPLVHQFLLPPLPASDTDPWSLDMLVLDMETTGLDVQQDSVLSLGMVPIRAGMVQLGQSQHLYLDACAQVRADTAVINHILPQTLQQGMSASQALMHLFTVLADQSSALAMADAECGVRVEVQPHGATRTEPAHAGFPILVAHGAAIERQFLQQWVSTCFGLQAELPLLWLDTLALERSLAGNRHSARRDYRLSEIRRSYGLPAYLAHNALADAVATGELLLVQMKHIFAGRRPQLGELYRRSLS